MKQANIFEVLR